MKAPPLALGGFALAVAAALSALVALNPAPASDSQQSARHPAPTGVTWTPLLFSDVSGTRPLVRALLNGKPLLLMVRANAVLYVMTTHAHAETLGLGNLTKTSDYGITSDGKLSPLGKSEATLDSLTVAGNTARDVHLSVFEIPQTPPTDGMLGIRWLRDRHVIVDYNQSRIGLPPPSRASEKPIAVAERPGYVPHPMHWDETTSGYYVTGTVNGVPGRLRVSTVGQNVLDVAFAKTAGLPMGAVVGQEGGPKGALVEAREVRGTVQITVDGAPAAPAKALSLDIYAYGTAERPAANADSGYLGADFMLANHAIVDFGSDTLYLPRMR